jgi:hypothetical protein
MKPLLLTTILALSITATQAQSNQADSTKTSHNTGITIGYGDDATHLNLKNRRKGDTSDTRKDHTYPKYSFGITLARMDLGLATLVDNGSFTLSPKNQFLSYRQWKTSNVGFDVLQTGVRFSNAFKIYLAAGFDWTLIRLRDNITILPNQPVLTYRQDNVDYSKNRFSASYLRIPLMFEFRTNEDAAGKRFHIEVGPEGAFLLQGKVKQISDQFGKQKYYDDYHYTTFRYGAVARIGYGAWGIFAKDYFSDMFENSPDQKGLKEFAFGIMLGF